MSCEQSSLTDCIIHKYGEANAKDRIAVLFGYYNALGYLAQALGALIAGNGIDWATNQFAISSLEAMRLVFYGCKTNIFIRHQYISYMYI